MLDTFDNKLDAIVSSGLTLAGGKKGIEKEALRLDLDGYLARTPHPAGLGSAMTNRFITTDFSEALLEFVSPVFTSTWEALRFLCDVHQFTYECLEDELLWVASMPCRIPRDPDIPLARYGTSNVGRMKTIYRRGLGFRYGRHMQTIAGIHFNYSLPEEFWPSYQAMLGDDGDARAFRSAQYLGLIRNFRRFGWLTLYLFGASPAMCKSFGGGEDLDMPELSRDTWYAPYGTSLRMSDLGYNNQNQSRINISLNDLDHYIDDLETAIRTPEPDYEDIGVIVDGKYRQLSANQLQIENEFYSPVRPKRVARSGERPTAALRRGGIEYVEIRSLDISVDDPAGINQNTMRFMEAFLIYCLLEESPPFDDAALEETRLNQSRTAREGRDPACRLLRDGTDVPLPEWGQEILGKVERIAAAIDRADGTDCYLQAARGCSELIDDPAQTPSGRLLREVQQSHSSFFEYAIAMARSHRDYFASITPMSEQRHDEFQQEARSSVERQREIEAADSISFEEYLAQYYSAE
ncbi:MAG: glutamate--cysteine ligase [Woeseiaceae bacterium]|nr:glutamate--cysteine ligase [Woeseiaceae bacterium]